MTSKEFSKLMSFRLSQCQKTLDHKEKEYASEKDRLHNFKRAAKIFGKSPIQMAIGMWSKHLTSVLDLLDDASNGKSISVPLLDEKFTDAINYIIIFEALIREQNKMLHESKE